MNKFILGVFFLTVKLSVFAQTSLPVIRASSKNVDIRDGNHFKKGYWYIMPEKRPDYYFAEIPRKEHTITFITDLDSISFAIKYGEEYDFVILLNNKDSCHTRIVARHKKITSYQSDHLAPSPDTIPFSIGDNSKIYFKGRINDSGPTLDIQFDLGAGGCIVKKSSVKKVRMKFDSSITLTNSDGTNIAPLSSSNILQVAGLKWDSLGFAVADNMTRREDLIVGNSLFQDKVVEINYDEKIIIIHDSLPPVDSRYSKHDIILDGVIPYLQASLTINSKTKTGWFLFDTGAYTTIFTTNEISPTYKLFNEARKMVGIDVKAREPHLAIGNYQFSDFNYTANKSSGDDRQLGLLGNDLLKRFNIILDNRNGHIYLKPNSLLKESYANPEYYAVRVGAAILVLIIAMVIFIFYRRRKKRRMLAKT
jgi:hypothetical protein